MTSERILPERSDSWALFFIKVELPDEEFRQFIGSLVNKFVLWCDPNFPAYTEYKYKEMPWNLEGSTGVVRIKSKSLVCVKLYFFDSRGWAGFQRSILFRDHYSEMAIEKVFLIADAFEEFLTEKNIVFERPYREK